jgi:hypothetical protein
MFVGIAGPGINGEGAATGTLTTILMPFNNGSFIMVLLKEE